MTAPRPTSFSSSTDTITDSAADYLQRRRLWDWNAADQAELDAWLAESTFHRVAYLRLERAATYAEHLAATHTVKVETTSGVGGRGKFGYRLFAIPLLAAASVAAMAIFGLPVIRSLLQPPDRMDSTDVGGRTVLSFSDHTQIELNTDTAMRIRMTTAERTIWLEKGEAWFHVAHDASHPFTVFVGKHRITDIGTEFLVRRNGDGVDVTLVNGRASLSAEGVQTAILNPGDEAIATAASLTMTRKTPQELADEMAWRRGILVFRNTPLAEVVSEFNRYNATKLVIADRSIADEKIVANVKANDYESFLQLAEVVLGLRVDREGSVILLSRASAEPKRPAHTHSRSGAP
jgi:transmembrane sensor